MQNADDLIAFLETFEPKPLRLPEGQIVPVGFDMLFVDYTESIREVRGMCVAGWIKFFRPELEQFSVFDVVHALDNRISKEASSKLCFPLFGEPMRATPKQAAQAVRNCLLHNDPLWLEVMA